MNLTPQDAKRAQKALRLVQLVLVVVLLVAIWTNPGIDLWQKLLATFFAGLLVGGYLLSLNKKLQ